MYDPIYEALDELVELMNEFRDLVYTAIPKSLFAATEVFFIRGHMVTIHCQVPSVRKHKGRFTSGFL